MPQPTFVHLHNHTMYSLLDGAIRIDDLASKAAQWGSPAVAITDHGNVYGIVPFYKALKEIGVKPILGCEVYVAIEGMRSRRAVRGRPDGANHFVLLAKNDTGYRNLLKIATAGHLQGFYYHPRVDKELLREHAEGLIGMSACLKGEIPELLAAGSLDRAREAAVEYDDIFGHGNFFLEVQQHGLPEEEKINPALVRLSKELDVPLVATNDSHYLAQDHAKAHEVLLCIQTNKTIEDPERMRFAANNFYLRSPQEMAELFDDLPEAVENTAAVAEACNVELELGQLKMPVFPVPEGFGSADEYLEHLVWENADNRFREITAEVKDRLTQELDIIRKTGFADYFLIVADYVSYARSLGTYIGLRGSGASSAVGYVLGIGTVDPLRHGLIFERFLHLERISPPDFDVDFADRDRDAIIQYVIDRYGKDKACQIITFGTMAARGVIRDVGRALNIPLPDVDRIAKLIPADPKMTLSRALETVPELKDMVESGGAHARLIDVAMVLEGLARHASVHAAGVVIAPDDLTDYMALARSSKNGGTTTQADMDAVKDLGLLKMDFLGLRNLTVIGDTVRMIRQQGNKDFDIDAIPLDDPETFDLLSRGDTIGVFQFESTGMQEYLRQLQPERIEDMIAMNALYRPGPMSNIPHYIRRKHGQEEIAYDHPLLEPILKETYGIIVYQEQVMQTARDLAGYSMGRADLLREAMGKKKADVMAEERQSFLGGCKGRGIDERTAAGIFDNMESFAGYGFNKCHATPYAYIAYQTAYLKAHYPAQFMAANLTSEMEDTDRVAVLIDGCRRMGIEVLPPDINESDANFTVVKDGIRFGLGAIKNVGLGPIEAIVQARQQPGPFSTLFDFCERVDQHALNKRVVESLILAGAMDSLEGHRAQLLHVTDKALEAGQAVQAARASGQTSLFEMPQAQKQGSLNQHVLPDMEPWTKGQLLAHEKEMLGFYVSGHPLDKYEDDLKAFATHTTETLREASENQEVKLGGIVTSVRTTTDRLGRPMSFVGFADQFGACEAIVFADVYEKYRDLIVPDSIALIKGLASVKGSDQPKIRVRELIPLKEVRPQYARAVHLSLACAGLTADTLDGLNSIAQSHPGKCGLLFHLDSADCGEVTIRSRNTSVSPNDSLLTGFREIVGTNSVWLS